MPNVNFIHFRFLATGIEKTTKCGADSQVSRTAMITAKRKCEGLLLWASGWRVEEFSTNTGMGEHFLA